MSTSKDDTSTQPNEEDARKTTNDAVASQPKLSLKLATARPKRKKTANLSQAFGGDDDRSRRDGGDERVPVASFTSEPLVIPVASNQMRWKKKAGDSIIQQEEESEEKHTPSTAVTSGGVVSAEDALAAQALQEQATSEKDNDASQQNNKLVIDTDTKTKNRAAAKETSETLQYKDDLEQLPDELPIDSDSYQKVPIAQFGAALLRGMGWQGDDNQQKTTTDDSNNMPRPHRLGLGATPKLVDSSAAVVPAHGKNRPRRPDQFRKQQALEQQNEAYKRQREKQLAMDKQRTLQNGSVVYVRSSSSSSSSQKRARILQLVGVPGLNMVKIQYERDVESSVVKRGDIEGLVSREELEQQPFREPTANRESRSSSDRDRKRSDRESSSSSRKRRDDDRDNESRRKSSGDRTSKEDRKRRRRDEEYSNSGRSSSSRGRERHESSSSSKPRRREQEDDSEQQSARMQWVMTNIRVRVVTEKLGRRYYKQKGVVVDVTPKGATLQMSSSNSTHQQHNTVLDRVPERYLETALPKVGGHVIVLAGPERQRKGRLLERNSRNATGTIQFFEDMHAMTLSLDDLAEWCGPLDDDLQE